MTYGIYLFLALINATCLVWVWPQPLMVLPAFVMGWLLGIMYGVFVTKRTLRGRA